jgi:molecular chaperone GrpE
MRSDTPQEQNTNAESEAQEPAAEAQHPQEPEAGADRGGASELEAQRDRYLRLAAEYDNYRKRTERERSESWIKAQAQLVERILDPLDDLQRVAHYSVENTSVEALLEGVQMVERKLLRALESAGLEPLDASGQPFDPAIHEAINTAPAESREEDDTVADVYQKGYQLKGVLLRPARVQVKKYQ